MLMDIAENKAPRPDNTDMKVAGLLDLAQLFKYAGDAKTAAEMKAYRSAILDAPYDMYQERKLFLDPAGRVMMDTGVTEAPGPLQSYSSLNELANQGQNLADYLNGTQIGDVFKNDLKNYLIGVAPMGPGFEAGATPPQFVNGQLFAPGFVAIGSHINPNEHLPLVEHEMQHVYQYILGMPRGTTPDEMSDDLMQFLEERGVVTPAKNARINKDAATDARDRSYQRYLSTLGEAEARAAERRGQYFNISGSTPDVLGAPTPSDYLWVPDDPYAPIRQSNLFPMTDQYAEEFKQWWQKKWAKP